MSSMHVCDFAHEYARKKACKPDPQSLSLGITDMSSGARGQKRTTRPRVVSNPRGDYGEAGDRE